MGSVTVTLDPSARDYADTSPAKLGRSERGVRPADSVMSAQLRGAHRLLLPSFAGKVSPSFGDGGVIGSVTVTLDPSARDDADPSPAELGRRMSVARPQRVFMGGPLA